MIWNIHEIFSKMDKELCDMNEGTIWSEDIPEGLSGAFRALCLGNLVDVDFEMFYNDLRKKLGAKN